MYRVFAIALLAALAAGPAAAQQYPAKSVRVVVPYPPGGGTDLLGRPMAQKLTAQWGQPVVIDNRGGASGMVGAEIASKAPPDGYTVLLSASAEVALNVAVYPKMNYDPERDLVPVTLMAISPLVLCVHPSMPARTPQEFIALAKKRPGEISYGSSGAGGPHHIAGEWMKIATGINIIHVPYRGGGPQLADLIAGHVHSSIISMPVVAPHAKSDRIRLLAVTSGKRSQLLPDVPSLSEAGIPGFDVSQWWAVFVPRGTPVDIVNKLQTDFVALTKDREIIKHMATLGAEPVGSTAPQLVEFMRTEIAKYRKIAKQANISVQ